MKKFLSILLVIAMASVIFAGCSPTQSVEPTPAATPTPSVEPTPVATPTLDPNAEKEEKYQNAIDLFNQKKYTNAKAIFKSLKDYKDSAEKVAECDAAIKEEDYAKAVKLAEEGKLNDAINAFKRLGNYKDCAEQIKILQTRIYGEVYMNTEVGSTIKYGKFEQDNNLDNGAEDIEWIVLEKNKGKVFVISKYVLDSMAFDTTGENVTWRTCTLQSWLNGDFFNNAFTLDEKMRISNSYVESEDLNMDESTVSKLFLLGMGMMNEYFENDSARMCLPTEYAKAHGVAISSDNGSCAWWLRTINEEAEKHVAFVSDIGQADEAGSTFDKADYGVRPVMWINMSDEGPGYLDSYYFGKYEQDNNLDNGPEDIEWYVLTKEDGKLLLVSRYALNKMAFDTTGNDVTWETSTIRAWLNGDFYNNAFTQEEMAKILETTITKDSTRGENDTLDNVFLLSGEEADHLFSKETEKKLKPTEYAKAQGVDVNQNNGNCWWWLRTKGDNEKTAVIVWSIGQTEYSGHAFDRDVNAVRPAIWIEYK